MFENGGHIHVYRPRDRGRIGHGQPRGIIYINFVELESPMLHAKFQAHRSSGFGEENIKFGWFQRRRCFNIVHDNDDGGRRSKGILFTL